MVDQSSRKLLSIGVLATCSALIGCHKEPPHEVLGTWSGTVGSSPVLFQFQPGNQCTITALLRKDQVAEKGIYTLSNGKLTLTVKSVDASNPVLQQFYAKKVGVTREFTVSWPNAQSLRLLPQNPDATRMIHEGVELTRA